VEKNTTSTNLRIKYLLSKGLTVKYFSRAKIVARTSFTHGETKAREEMIYWKIEEIPSLYFWN
jgi:hypothetical protein